MRAMLEVLGDCDLLFVVGGERARRSIFDDGRGVGDGLNEALAAARVVRGPADELVVEIVGAEDGHLGEEELALDAVRVGVVEYGPYGDLDR